MDIGYPIGPSNILFPLILKSAMDVQQHRLLFVWNEVSDNATEGLPSAGALEDGSFEPGFRYPITY